MFKMCLCGILFSDRNEVRELLLIMIFKNLTGWLQARFGWRLSLIVLPLNNAKAECETLRVVTLVRILLKGSLRTKSKN